MSSWHTSGSDDSNPGRAYGSDPDEVSSSGITYFCDSSQFSCLRLSSTGNTPEYSGAVGGTYGIGSTSEDIGGFYDIGITPEYSGTVGSYGIGSTPEYAGAIGGSHGVGSTLEYSGAVGSDGSCSEEEDDRGLYLDLDQERRSQLDPVGAAGVQETLSSGCNSSSSRINTFDPGLTKKGKPRKVMAWQRNDLTEDPELRAKTDPAKKQRIRRETQKKELEALKQTCEILESENKKAVKTTRALRCKVDENRAKELKLQNEVQNMNKKLQQMRQEMNSYIVNLENLIAPMDSNSSDGMRLQALLDEMRLRLSESGVSHPEF